MAAASVVREPLIYDLHAGTSFFADVMSARAGGDQRAVDALARLARHQREMDVELTAREHRSSGERGDITTRFERRANPSRLPSAGGSFVPPLWAIDLFATFQRPERVLADLAMHFALPDGVQSVSVPRLITGTVATTSADDAPVPDQDFTDAAATSPVVTIAGESVVALQLLEQSGAHGAHLDLVVLKDLYSAYDANLEAQLMLGSGAPGPNGQVLGALNLTGINAVTFTSASPTVSALYPLLGQAFGAVSNSRKIAAQCWIMRGGRWAQITSSEDSQGRPLTPPTQGPGASDAPGPDAIGGLLGLPVYLSETVPSNLGAGTNQDIILAARPSDMLLWEGQPRVRVMTEMLSGTLQARIQLHTYAAAITGRWPSGVAVLGGTGMVVSTNE